MAVVLPEGPGPPHSFLRKLLPLYLFFFFFLNLSDICCLSLGARKHLVCQKYPLLIQNVVITVVITMSGDIVHDKHYYLFIYFCHALAACGFLVP